MLYKNQERGRERELIIGFGVMSVFSDLDKNSFNTVVGRNLD